MEGVWEEVGEEASFCVGDSFDIADETERAAVSYASHHGIEANGLKLIHERFCSNPVVS